MTHSTARVPTVHASRYLQQLCKHWAHRFEVTFDPLSGRVDFGDAVCILKADEQALDVRIDAEPEEMDRWERVLATHLNRFAHREGELPFAWARA